MPVAARDIPYFLSRFDSPPTVDQLVAEMQAYEIPSINARAVINDEFRRGSLRLDEALRVHIR